MSEPIGQCNSTLWVGGVLLECDQPEGHDPDFHSCQYFWAGDPS